MTANDARSRRGRRSAVLLSAVAGGALLAGAAQAQEEQSAGAAAVAAGRADAIIVTARRVSEDVQSVPIPVSVIGGEDIAESGTFNVGRLTNLIPSIQFYSTNGRNTSLNIRGIGAPFGLTNDGLDAGVGVYVDGVFYARPAASIIDFIDVQQIEVLRGPQGTLYGKNTTAGAVNITTQLPSFEPEGEYEISYGDFGFVQAKGSISGPLLGDKLAGRLSFSGTQRDGVIYSTSEEGDINDLNNLGVRGQLLYQPNDTFSIRLTGDTTRQRIHGNTLVLAGVVPTLRPANRQYAALAARSVYNPVIDPFSRVADTDSLHQAHQDFSGVALNVDWDVGPGTLTSITAWRYWNWKPSNDRDFTGLPITTISQNPNTQEQWSQEFRYAGDLNERLSFVLGAFAFQQEINSLGQQEQGSYAYIWLLPPSANANTPGLLDGYGQNAVINYENLSAALFAQVEWSVTHRFRLIPGVRFNYDEKKVDYNATVYGGLQTTNPALIQLQRSVLAPLAYQADIEDDNISGQLTAAYDLTDDIYLYATYSTAFKPVGLNLGGIPVDASSNPILETAVVDPEEVSHIELGVKTRPFDGWTANLTAYRTDIDNYQVQVFNAAQPGVLRGYLANAEQARVQGVELDLNGRITENFSLQAAIAYADGEYVKFVDSPPPLEGTGGPQSVDISGTRLPGISDWAASLGGEYAHPTEFLGRTGELFVAADASYRTDFSSSAAESRYLVVDDYGLVNARVGFRADDGWDIFLWSRNLLDQEYFEQLSAAPGGSGLYAAQLGDPRISGVTLRGRF